MVAENQSRIIVLVTTYNRPQLLDSRALTSISNQKGTFDEIILIDNSDSESICKQNEKLFLDRFPHGVYQVNNSHPSAAGTWNQGLHWIEENHPGAWGAIIDDDDEWLDNHLEVCEAAMDGNDAVISGIRTFIDGELVDDRLPSSLSIGDFFANNPGWQGSNTFARVSKLLEAGGFDENLLCTHDRD